MGYVEHMLHHEWLLCSIAKYDIGPMFAVNIMVQVSSLHYISYFNPQVSIGDEHFTIDLLTMYTSPTYEHGDALACVPVQVIHLCRLFLHSLSVNSVDHCFQTF